jgi:hypothetical protein
MPISPQALAFSSAQNADYRHTKQRLLIKGGKEVYGWDRTMCLDIINIDDENL